MVVLKCFWNSHDMGFYQKCVTHEPPLPLWGRHQEHSALRVVRVGVTGRPRGWKHLELAVSSFKALRHARMAREEYDTGCTFLAPCSSFLATIRTNVWTEENIMLLLFNFFLPLFPVIPLANAISSLQYLTNDCKMIRLLSALCSPLR